MRYQLSIDGVAEEGADIDHVAARLGALTRQDATVVRRILAGGPRVVKRHLELEVARRLETAVRETGASCSVEVMLDGSVLRGAPTAAHAASFTRAGPRWVLSVGKLKPWFLALPRSVPVRSPNGLELFKVRSRRLVLGKLFRLLLVIEVTLQVQGAVINAATAALGNSPVTSAIGIACFFGVLYVLAVAARVPRKLQLTASRGQPALWLEQKELPWKGVSGYRLGTADGAVLGMIRRDQFRQITRLYDADGVLVCTMEPAGDVDAQGEDAATDLAEEFLNAGPYGYLRDLAGWLMGGSRQAWTLRAADGAVLGSADIGSELSLRLRGQDDYARRYLAMALAASGV